MHAAIRRLRLRLPAIEAAARAQWAIEEAFRLSGRDGGQRLILIRRLALRRLTPNLNARLDAQLRELIAAARPACEPGSAEADSVYFESPQAARAALLGGILRGVAPTAWFWRQAVPEWRPESDAAPLSLLQTLWSSPQGRVALAPEVAALVAERREQRLGELVTQEVARRLVAVWPGPGWSAVAPHVANPPAVETLPRPPAGRLSDALMRLTSHWRENDARRLWWIAAALPARAPHLASLSSFSVATAEAALFGTRGHAQAAPSTRAPPAHRRGPLTTAAPQAEKLPMLAPDGAARVRPARSAELQARPTALLPASILEERSVAAGLFLLVRPLEFMGFERWLERRPREAEQGFGWSLLRAIAKRQRIPDDDPLWRRLSPGRDLQVEETAWRVGLDRMLRRRCGLNLAAVAKRPGWLSGGAGCLTLRFPQAAADVRLRRFAFDVDPGFTPWLGLDLAYLFEDRWTP